MSGFAAVRPMIAVYATAIIPVPGRKSGSVFQQDAPPHNLTSNQAYP
jgi:hypothetical protein